MPKEKRRIHLVDTTLRDGEQRAGLAFCKDQKIACARLMDEAGIDQIEAGVPAMCRQEQITIRSMLERRRHAKIATWNRMNEQDIRASLALAPDMIHICVPVSDIQIHEKLKQSRDYVSEAMKRCIGLAQTGNSEVSIGLEDASRADIDFMVAIVQIAVHMGVSRIRYADTVGVAFPTKIQEHFHKLCETGAAMECHTHDDLGMAVANALQAAKQGATYIDTTFFGIGERAGNCDLRKFLAAASDNFSFGVLETGCALPELEAKIQTILHLKPNANRSTRSVDDAGYRGDL